MAKPSSSETLASQIIGSWSLLSRIDRAADGTERRDHALGRDALGMLTYVGDRFAAQFMKRDRSTASTPTASSGGGQNNTTAVGGYDAYFGTWRVMPNGDVLHRLEAALTRENIGLEVSRKLTVDGDSLTIVLQTTSAEKEPITRTLTWRRIV